MVVGGVFVCPGFRPVNTNTRKATTSFGILASACLYVSHTMRLGSEKGRAIHFAREAKKIGLPITPNAPALYVSV